MKPTIQLSNPLKKIEIFVFKKDTVYIPVYRGLKLRRIMIDLFNNKIYCTPLLEYFSIIISNFHSGQSSNV